MTATGVRQWAGYLLASVGLAALSWSGVEWGRAQYEQAVRVADLPSIPAVETAGSGRALAVLPGRTLGVLEVPRLGLSTIVVEGDDSSMLAIAAGHLSDTPLPWDDGNSAIAGHRDGDFRPLRGIRRGDTLRFLTADAEMEYVVQDMRVVDPADVSVLRATPRPTLTLITCFPFNFIGPAPARFVVRAERTASAPLRRAAAGG